MGENRTPPLGMACRVMGRTTHKATHRAVRMLLFKTVNFFMENLLIRYNCSESPFAKSLSETEKPEQ
jgi:hypothetical protein